MIASYTEHLMEQLQRSGVATVYTDPYGVVSVSMARARLHNAARRLGVRVWTEVIGECVIGHVQ